MNSAANVLFVFAGDCRWNDVQQVITGMMGASEARTRERKESKTIIV